MYFNKTIFSENLEPIEVELICEKCGKCINVKDLSILDKVRSEYCIINENQNIECECGNKSGSGIIEPKKGTMIPKHNQTIPSSMNTPKCPKCGSSAISTGARGVNFTFGFLGASKTVNRCANCGHTWKP